MENVKVKKNDFIINYCFILTLMFFSSCGDLGDFSNIDLGLDFDLGDFDATNTTTSSIWNSGFVYNKRWKVDENPRMIADVNGDGKGDVIAFGDNDVWVSLSNGSSFYQDKIWISGYVESQHWRVDKHVRTVADVNGDGKADIVAFGSNAVYVSLSTGSSFSKGRVWNDGFVYNKNWRVDENPRMIADVNGDGKGDIIAFGDNDVWVSLSNGNSFNQDKIWISGYVESQHWRVDKHVRTVADVNGDGKADIVAFGSNGVYVSLSTGNKFLDGTIWNSGFVYNENWVVRSNPIINNVYDQNWEVKSHPRMIADVNGDGNGDIVAFGDNDVWVSLSNGSSFSEDKIWVSSEYVESQGWRGYKNPRMSSDVDGDGKADIVAFGDNDVWVTKSEF
jgi:hypothetical protein